MNRVQSYQVRCGAMHGFPSFSYLHLSLSFLFPYTPDSGSEMQPRGPGGGDLSLFFFRRYLDTVLIGKQYIVTSK